MAEARNDKGKLTKASVKARLAEVKGDKSAAEERKVLAAYADLIEQEAAAGKQVKDALKTLDDQVGAKYKQLEPDDVRQLVVHDKWLATLAQQVEGEMDRVSQALAGRLKQLAERYATPLPQLLAEVDVLSARVDEHLKKMGFVW